jgi:hypothetical protein
MVDFNLIAELDIQHDEADSLIRTQLGAEVADGDMASVLSGEIQQYSRGKILNGKVVGKAGDDAIIDVGLRRPGQQGRVRQLGYPHERRHGRGTS